MLILEVGMNGTFVAQDLILFFVFFEIVLLPMFFMIGVWGGPNRRVRVDQVLPVHAVRLGADAAELPGAVLPGGRRPGHPGRAAQLRHGAALERGRRRASPTAAQLLIFAGLFLGFAIKVPMFPFHTWLPDAHTEAPTVGSVLLAAILLKLGTYGFVRIALPILPEAAKSWAPWIGLLAVIGIIYGALGCLAQTDMKRLIAFSSVAHMGFVMLGIASLTTFGINAADLRHGRPRSHHRHALLHRRFGAAQLPHPRDLAPRWPPGAGAEDGLDPRVLRDGEPRAARPRRVLG